MAFPVSYGRCYRAMKGPNGYYFVRAYCRCSHFARIQDTVARFPTAIFLRAQCGSASRKTYFLLPSVLCRPHDMARYTCHVTKLRSDDDTLKHATSALMCFQRQKFFLQKLKSTDMSTGEFGTIDTLQHLKAFDTSALLCVRPSDQYLPVAFVPEHSCLAGDSLTQVSDDSIAITDHCFTVRQIAELSVSVRCNASCDYIGYNAWHTPDRNLEQTGLVTPNVNKQCILSENCCMTSATTSKNVSLFVTNNFSFDERHLILMHNLYSSTSDGKTNLPPGEGRKKANLDQLQVVQDYFSENWTKLFVKYHDYSAYTPDIVLENNWYPGKTYVIVGKPAYAFEINRLRAFMYVKYARVKMTVLKATVHESDSTVRVHWRVSGIPQAKAFMFWRYLPWTSRSPDNKELEWTDGFSTLYINGSGVIYKHQIDKVIPDQAPELNAKSSLIEKLTSVTPL